VDDGISLGESEWETMEILLKSILSCFVFFTHFTELSQSLGHFVNAALSVITLPRDLPVLKVSQSSIFRSNSHRPRFHWPQISRGSTELRELAHIKTDWLCMASRWLMFYDDRQLPHVCMKKM